MVPPLRIEQRIDDYKTPVIPFNYGGMAGTENFEISTYRLTADCSTSELRTNIYGDSYQNWTGIAAVKVLFPNH